MTGLRLGRAVITLVYQRERSNGTYFDVHQRGRRALARVAVIVRRR